MNSIFKNLIIFLLMTLAICCSGASSSDNFQKVKSAQNQDQKLWEKIFFEGITERIKGSEITNLRDVNLPPDSKEIRIWAGFDLSPIRGFILKQSNDKWEAYYVPPLEKTSNSRQSHYLLPPPKSGWENLWEKLHSLGIETLPDSVDIGMEDDYIDERSVIVEIKTHNSYRTYRLFGLEIPKESKREPVQKILKISNILADEFGVQLYYYVPE